MTELPALLLPYQVDAIKTFGDNQLVMVEKSRRIGLSYAVAPWALTIAAAAKGSQNVYYIGYNLDMAREFIGYCAEFAEAFDAVRVSVPPSEMVLEEHRAVQIGPGQVVESGNVGIADDGSYFLIDGGTKGIKTFRIDLPSGKAVAALPSTPRSVRGKQGIFVIDEAAFHDDLEGLIKAILAALIWGGQVVVISTHDGVDNYFNELIEAIRAGRREGTVIRITLKDALEQGLYRRICLVQGKNWSQELEDTWEASLRKTYGDAADEELDVIPARGTGSYLARATIEAACSPLYPVLRLSCPVGFERNDLDWRTDWVAEWLETEIAPLLGKLDQSRYAYFGQDYARSNDLSVIALGQYDELATLICQFIVEMRNVPSREQLQVFDFILGRIDLFAAGKVDARGNGQDVAAYLQDHYGEDRIEAVMASPKTYLAMMPRLKARIEDRTIVIPKSEGVIDDLRLIKLVKGVPSVVDRADDRADGSKNRRHGDAAIALMHLVAAADEEAGPFEFESAGPRASGGAVEATDTGFGTVRRAATDDFQNLGSAY